MPTPIVAANICSVNLFSFFGVGVEVYLQSCGGLLYYSIGLYQTPPMKSPQQPSQHGVFYRLRQLELQRLHRILCYFSNSPFISLCYIQLQKLIPVKGFTAAYYIAVFCILYLERTHIPTSRPQPPQPIPRKIISAAEI